MYCVSIKFYLNLQAFYHECRSLIAQLISESYNNSHNRVKITPQGGVTIFGVNITPKRSYFFF